MRFAFIRAEKACFSVAALCRALGVSRQGYYRFCKQPPSDRLRRDAALQVFMLRVLGTAHVAGQKLDRFLAPKAAEESGSLGHAGT